MPPEPTRMILDLVCGETVTELQVRVNARVEQGWSFIPGSVQRHIATPPGTDSYSCAIERPEDYKDKNR